MALIFKLSRNFTGNIFLLMFFAFISLLALSCSKNNSDFSGYVDADFVYISSPINAKIEGIYVVKGGNVLVGETLFRVEDYKQKADYSSVGNAETSVSRYFDDMSKGVRPEEIGVWNHVIKAAAALENIGSIELKMTSGLLEKNAITANYHWIAQSFHLFSYHILLAASEQLNVMKLGSREDKILAVAAIRESIRAQIPYFKRQLDECHQMSPYDALVFDVFYRKGEHVAAGKPVVALLPPGNVKAVFFVDGTVVNSLKIGDKVEVALSGYERPLEASISYISTRSDYTAPYIYSVKNNEKLVYLVEAAFGPCGKALPHPGQPISVKRAMN